MDTTAGLDPCHTDRIPASALSENEVGWSSEAARKKAWIQFLQALQRVWNKAMNYYRADGRWSNWHKKYLDTRKKDELLAYLDKARGRSEHSVKPVAWTMPPYALAERAAGGVFTLDDLDFAVDGTPKFKVPINVQHHAAEVVHVPIEYEGRRYPPPNTHMGVPLPAGDIAAAEAGLAWYRNFLEAAEAKFVDEK